MSTRGGGGSTPVPFFCPNLPKFIGSSNHPEINSNTLEIQFFVTFFVIFRPFRSPMIQWVQGVWFLIILRAFYIKMSRVASRIYALLSVIRQQMSPFDPFRGGVAQRGHVPFFYRFFYLEASLRKIVVKVFHSRLWDHIRYQNVCFFIVFINRGGGVKPIYKKVRTTFGMFWWAYLQHKLCIKGL